VINQPTRLDKKIKPDKSIISEKKVTKVHEKPKVESKKVQNPEPKNEIYQIELYSTPSIEDAEIWMGKLKKRSINATLQLQKVRGMTVYKIRYGYFKTRQEAQESAIKLGFSRSWIDRIK
jgi:cell division septation protein DedD